ncbi:MAG: acyl carrier protein [Spirochaetales bacterium]|nr:acyl carrier protein [Spirochaetales bacterium]
MTRDEVKELVNNVLIEEFEKNEDELKEDASLFDDLELDSLDGIDLIVALEKAVKSKTGKETKIDEEKAKSLKTVGDIYNVIEGLK